ncbi:MAG TPA: MFS transporter [Gaiellaceae bacterium]|nr:MFS transporter [Gaiellaceae bacterium]
MSDATRLDFWKFFTGQTLSNLGSSFTGFALPLLVYTLTGSAVNLAIATAAYFVPYLLFGLLIGAWVDRVDRKRMMILADLGRGALIASIPVLSYADALSVSWIYAGTFLTACLTIAFDAGEFAAVPSLVGKDDLVTANGRIMASYQAAQIAGPLLAGLLIAVVSIEELFLVDAASFVVSAASLASIRRSFNPEQPPERKHILRDVSEGLRYVLRHPVLRNISLMMAMINFVASTLWAQLVLFGKVELDATDSQVGFLFAAGSAGVVVFGLSAGWIRRRIRFSVAALGAMMLEGVLVIVFSAVPWYVPALILWAAIQGLGLFFNINTTSLRQQIVPSHMLGRVVSIAGVLAWSAIPAGTLLGGWVVEETGDVALVYGAIGVLVVAIASAFWFTALGHAEDYLPAEGEAPPEPELPPVPAGVPLPRPGD